MIIRGTITHIRGLEPPRGSDERIPRRRLAKAVRAGFLPIETEDARPER